ncbi:unnamed protein product [Lampetra planeri]
MPLCHWYTGAAAVRRQAGKSLHLGGAHGGPCPSRPPDRELRLRRWADDASSLVRNLRRLLEEPTDPFLKFVTRVNSEQIASLADAFLSLARRWPF